jgi:dolichyl-phosphate-mannose-protein mannosyltransferase
MLLFRTKYLPLLLCLIASYFTFVHRYQEPPQFFWDENYYLTGAEKYKEGVFFMQTHPPLGKLLIALGDVLLKPNANIENDFVDFDHVKKSPPDFSFTGYRLLPVLLGAGGALLLYFIFLGILGKPWWALSLSSLYLFDNAQILQSRGAMLDSIFTFFFLGYLFFTLRIFQKQGKLLGNTLFAAVFFGLLVTTKDSGFLFAPLLAVALAKVSWPNLKKCSQSYLLALSSFAVIFSGVWCLHYNLFSQMNPKLKNEGRYDASPESLQLIFESSWVAPWNLPQLLTENYRFVRQDHSKIPKLNLCKPSENGAPVWLWPFGVRAINYRWETTDKGETHRYLNLVANPVIWSVSLLTLLLIFGMAINQLVRQEARNSFFKFPVISLMGIFLLYLLVLNSYDRVFFLYSYFPALNISFILLAFLIKELPHLNVRGAILKRLPHFLILLPTLSFASFLFFSPFTYHLPLTRQEFESRAWLKIWNLRCVNCEREGIFVPKQ